MNIQQELVTLDQFQAAQECLRGVTVRTPLVRLDIPLGSGREIHIKAESAQPIGSFKLRGAYNKIAQLAPDLLSRGVITYSSGNHAQGVAYAARALGAKCVIVMPVGAPLVKREATLALGAEVVLVGPASSERKLKAEELAARHGYTMVPPYDDPAIIAGQGTCGLEILEQLPDVGLVLSPVSGGGLLSGVATAIKRMRDHVKVFGAEPELAADAKESFESGKLVEWLGESTTRTIADGLRTQSLGALNFAHIVKFVDGIVTVSEDEILAAMRVILRETDLVPEPSGAVTLAAALFHAEQLPAAHKTVVVMSGGNVEPELLQRLRAGG